VLVFCHLLLLYVYVTILVLDSVHIKAFFISQPETLVAFLLILLLLKTKIEIKPTGFVVYIPVCIIMYTIVIVPNVLDVCVVQVTCDHRTEACPVLPFMCWAKGLKVVSNSQDIKKHYQVRHNINTVSNECCFFIIF